MLRFISNTDLELFFKKKNNHLRKKEKKRKESKKERKKEKILEFHNIEERILLLMNQDIGKLKVFHQLQHGRGFGKEAIEKRF